MKKELRIASKIENLREVEKLIDEISDDHSISEDVYGNLLIAILEGANNAILHGNKQDENKDVLMTFEMEDRDFHITIQDQGSGFDYENIPDPTAPENIENINGRGVFLMEKLSDEIEFSDEGRMVKLSFRI